MPKNKQFQVSFKIRKVMANLYLFLVALYLFLGATYLTNIIINLTVGGSIGPYFEFINDSIDRIMIYALNFTTMLYVVIKFPQKITFFLLLFTYVLAGYFVFIQILDALIMLASFIVLTWLLTGPKPFSVMSRGKTISLVVVYLVLILMVIELLSVVCWLFFPFFPELSQEGTCRYLVDLETKMFLLNGCLAPLFAVFFIFSWTAKFFSRCDPLKRFSNLFIHDSKGLNEVYFKKSFASFLFVCSVAFSFLVVLYPYLPGLNVNAHPIGVDTSLYEKWLTKLGNGNLFSVFTKVFFEHPDRPLSLFIMYLAKRLGGFSALTVAQFFPVILAPLLVLAVYFFMRETSGSNCTPSLAAFLAVSSFHVSVGMYAGFLSNWMALIELYLFMGFFFGFLRKKSYLMMLGALLLSISLLFTHSWTWGMAMGILFVYFVITLFKRKSGGGFLLETQVLFVIIFINVLVGVMRNYALGWSAGDFETLKVAQNVVSTCSLASFWRDVLYTFLHTMYGFFVNPIALFLGILGGLVVVFEDRPVNRYLISWLVCSCIFFVLSSGWVIKSRILFNVPLPVFESLGLTGVGNIIQKTFEPNEASLIRFLTIMFVLLVSLNYAFRCAFAMSQVV